MTTKLIITLVVLLGTAYRVFLNILRRRSAKNPIPESVADVYDTDTYLKWREYSAEHNKLALVFDILSSTVTLALLLSGAYSAVASLFGGGYILEALAVVLLASVAESVLGIPKSYIASMKIEGKYGFNRSTKKTFVVDSIRGFLVSTVLSFALAMAMALAHSLAGDWLAIVFAAIMFAFSMLISFLYPILSRIGNKFTPLPDGELKEKLLALLGKYGYKVKAIEVMDASRRTTKLNAYFTGFGKMKTIVLYDNLLNAMTEDEICAVFAHEMGHGLNRDVVKMQALNIVQMFLIGCIAWLTVSLPALHLDFGFGWLNYGFAYVLVGEMLGVLQPLIGLVTSALSRRHEFRADRQAVKEGYGEAMISAFKKLARDNFADLSPSRLNVILEYSHPPIAERVDAVRKEMRGAQK